MLHDRRSASTLVHTLLGLQGFFVWLEKQSGLTLNTVDLNQYFKPSRRMMALAQVSAAKHIPSLDDLHSIIAHMPCESFAQRRDRAMLAFCVLTGVRIGALLSLRIKDNCVARREVSQNPYWIKTKNSKHMITYWFPVGEEIEAIVISWIEEISTLTQSEDGLVTGKHDDTCIDRRDLAGHRGF